VMAASVPTSVLQEIFSGSAVAINPGILDSFTSSLHGLFLLMGFISLFAAVPAYMAKKQGPKYEVAEEIEPA
jgi:hypothetical protein